MPVERYVVIVLRRERSKIAVAFKKGMSFEDGRSYANDLGSNFDVKACLKRASIQYLAVDMTRVRKNPRDNRNRSTTYRRDS